MLLLFHWISGILSKFWPWLSCKILHSRKFYSRKHDTYQELGRVSEAFLTILIGKLLVTIVSIPKFPTKIILFTPKIAYSHRNIRGCGNFHPSARDVVGSPAHAIRRWVYATLTWKTFEPTPAVCILLSSGAVVGSFFCRTTLEKMGEELISSKLSKIIVSKIRSPNPLQIPWCRPVETRCLSRWLDHCHHFGNFWRLVAWEHVQLILEQTWGLTSIYQGILSLAWCQSITNPDPHVSSMKSFPIFDNDMTCCTKKPQW